MIFSTFPSVCLDCTAPKRHPGCSVACETYITAKVKFEMDKQMIREAKHAQNVADNTVFMGHQRRTHYDRLVRSR